MFGAHFFTLPFALAYEGDLLFPAYRENIDFDTRIPGSTDLGRYEWECFLVSQFLYLCAGPVLVNLLPDVSVEA